MHFINVNCAAIKKYELIVSHCRGGVNISCRKIGQYTVAALSDNYLPNSKSLSTWILFWEGGREGWNLLIII